MGHELSCKLAPGLHVKDNTASHAEGMYIVELLKVIWLQRAAVVYGNSPSHHLTPGDYSCVPLEQKERLEIETLTSASSDAGIGLQIKARVSIE
ncbi:hypothetical protein TNCT_289451 [Trichonephila clavata]|uniref:Uncharacterized protein n=1 Tax=Trichonephila clavata TaxID=2740835 RepID=A0A8X6LV06_TRICU|nr:hypothetical protein TNCT_289451 [Trichonephila clavata]